jgi:hypothetical protein
MRGLLLAGALVAAGPAAAQEAGQGSCGRDLFMTKAAMQQTSRRLDEAGQDPVAQCRAWRLHVETLRKAKAVYERCSPASERAGQAAATERTIGEFAGLLRERCRGQ